MHVASVDYTSCCCDLQLLERPNTMYHINVTGYEMPSYWLGSLDTEKSNYIYGLSALVFLHSMSSRAHG